VGTALLSAATSTRVGRANPCQRAKSNFLQGFIVGHLLERSFSKLKIIKNYLRNSIGQKRISNISVLNIEQYRTKEIHIERIVTNFSIMKEKRMRFD